MDGKLRLIDPAQLFGAGIGMDQGHLGGGNVEQAVAL